MLPTNKFRWLVLRNVVTAEQVVSYSDKFGVSLEMAKKALINRHPPVLQQWWETEGYEHESFIAAGGEWRDVPTEYEEHPQEKPE